MQSIDIVLAVLVREFDHEKAIKSSTKGLNIVQNLPDISALFLVLVQSMLLESSLKSDD